MVGFGSCWTIRVPKIHEPNHQSLKEGADDSSPFTSLPDDAILQILNKVIDLKTLCLFSLVSKRFSSIVSQVDAVSFTAPRLNSPDKTFFPDVDGDGFPKKLFRRLINGVVVKPCRLLRHRKTVAPSKPLPPSLYFMSSFFSQSFRSAVKSFTKFKLVKSLSLELPSSRHKGIDDSLHFKWKVQFGTTIESFFFLSPNSISETDQLHVNGNGDESNDLLLKKKFDSMDQCTDDVIWRHQLFWVIAKDLPMLEEVSITESGRRGRIFISGGKLAEVKKDWALSKLYSIVIPSSLKHCYVPVLNLPVSGYVMKGISLFVMEMNGFQVGTGNDDLMNIEYGFEDKEDAAYTEAVMQILEKHKDRMKELPLYEH